MIGGHIACVVRCCFGFFITHGTLRSHREKGSFIRALPNNHTTQIYGLRVVGDNVVLALRSMTDLSDEWLLNMECIERHIIVFT